MEEYTKLFLLHSVSVLKPQQNPHIVRMDKHISVNLKCF